MRGSISRQHPWDIMPDLYFYRDPEEVKKMFTLKLLLSTNKFCSMVSLHFCSSVVGRICQNIKTFCLLVCHTRSLM